jgi:hypothetical protein
MAACFDQFRQSVSRQHSSKSALPGVLTAPSWTSLTKHTVPMRTLPGSWLEVDTV